MSELREIRSDYSNDSSQLDQTEVSLKRTVNIELLSHQWNALMSMDKYTGLIGGIGSGKTYLGALWTLKQTNEYPHALGFIGANSYDQLINSTLAGTFKVYQDLNVPYHFNKNTKILEVYNKKFLCKTMDNYDLLRGIEVGDFWLDEAQKTKLEAVKLLMGRLRDKRGALRGLFTASPAGYNYLYDHFHPSGEKYSPEFRMFNARSKDNVHLPEGYLESLYKQFSSKQIQQELEGEFVNMSSGLIYYGHKRENNVLEFDYEKESEGRALWGGMDFNVNPMTSVFGYMKDNVLYIFEEFYLEDSNTTLMSQRIKSKLGTTGVNIVPDSTGNARKTASSGMTDHLILKQAGFKVEYSPNPFRMDRYNCVNTAFEKGKVIIHPRCKKTINDLERHSFKKGTNDPDDSDKTLGHISDALGYLICKLFPIRVKKPYEGSIILS